MYKVLLNFTNIAQKMLVKNDWNLMVSGIVGK